MEKNNLIEALRRGFGQLHRQNRVVVVTYLSKIFRGFEPVLAAQSVGIASRALSEPWVRWVITGSVAVVAPYPVRAVARA